MILSEILLRYRDRVINEWINRLYKISSRYRKRPKPELLITVSAAYDASFAVLVYNDFKKIDCHIEWITRARLQGGFSLPEVQNAYELYREIILPIFLRELKGRELKGAVSRLNDCLFYTITQFSRNFQSLHEKEIRDYAQNLELMVAERAKELAESEAKYRTLVEEINDGYFVNKNGIMVFANKAYCDQHGYTLEEVIGRPYSDFIAPESLAYVKNLYEKRVDDENVQDLYVYYRRHKDGRIFPTENKVKMIFYEGERAVAGICRDITGRMEMEKKIRETENLAHIGKLTTSLAHEIRNPLSSVKMNIQILLKNVSFDGNDKRRMEIMSSEISRLERILAEMLDFARPIKLKRELISMNEIIDSCLEIMDIKTKEKGIDVTRRSSKYIPPVWMDRDKVEQAIINVLLNSVEAIHYGGEIKILTRYEKKNNGYVKVDIKDNGPGIDKEDLPYVFDPFFSNKKKGTGLGLSNVKKIVGAHGGSVSITSRKGRGIHFSMSIPATESQ